MGAVLSKKKSSQKANKHSTQRSIVSNDTLSNSNSSYSNLSNHGDPPRLRHKKSSNHTTQTSLFDTTDSKSVATTITATSPCSVQDAMLITTPTKEPNHMHHTDSFFLPDQWDSKEYQYNLHFALKTLFDGNVTSAVAPSLKKGSRVIQMGLCSGPWIMDMATLYPDCHFTGVELASEKIQSLPQLPNIAFQRGDVFQTGLETKDKSVDYIHLRGVGTLVCSDQWLNIFTEIKRVLKPEGVLRIEEMHHSPTGTVMIESFFETLRDIAYGMKQDPQIAVKYGDMLQKEGFQVTETRKKRVHYASDGKLSQEFVSSILSLYDQKGAVIAPKLGLDMEDYHHRVETICGECVRIDAYLEWYSWVAVNTS